LTRSDPRIIRKEQAEYDEADVIIVPSNVVADSFVQMGVPRSKLQVVPLGVNLSTFKPTAPRAKEFRVLFPAQLAVRKGLHYLFEAFRKADLPDTKLIIAGGHTEDTKALLAHCPAKNVDFKGILSRPDLATEMSRASVMVLPSIEEGMALVQGMAMACGCPVIASDKTGSKDLFTDGREGFIVPVGDVDAIVERLTRLHADRSLVETMSAAGIQRVRQFGGWNDYGRQTIDLFGRLSKTREFWLADHTASPVPS
jgi:glycosyltransferase involved in cell wall biosynthesis